MKIAIPVDEKNLESTVCVSFGRTPYFLIYDMSDDAYTFIDNSAATSQGGAGIKAAQNVVDQKVNALLTPRCGENAYEVLSGAKVSLYKTSGTSIKENITLFKESRLPILSEVHSGFHGHR